MSPETEHELLQRLSAILPKSRIFTDELRRLAYGTDASFYRLIPRVVVRVEKEQEVVDILSAARSLQVPVTFRAAGTSLSGQAISDSILVVVSESWNGHVMLDDGCRIKLDPAVVGAHANVFLAPYGRKIGPDPASINSAMMGGIAANNASGMCCGTAQNTYRTLESLRAVLADGSILDTADQESRRKFLAEHAEFVTRISGLSHRAKTSPLAERIRAKFKMKNTTGYSLNALVDFDDPIDIIQHLLIGSEGTLGFISSIILNTVPELPFKASSLMVFPDIGTACQAVTILKSCRADAVELMDRASLRSVENKPGMPEMLAWLGTDCAALLVEIRAETAEGLSDAANAMKAALSRISMVAPASFTTDPAQCATLWNIRKGLFPSVGAMRKTGTTVIIEDVAFPLLHLAQATLDLRTLFRRHGYDHAIIFGHALEGNLHFVFHQDFNDPKEVARYASFIEDVTALVVGKYDGSLKAEHGTGRNMAPFVEMEWGRDAFRLMREIKEIFDPLNILNPGVILNDDPQAHIQHLKPLPEADPLVDKCIECGFCEVHCPSRRLTLTPRQRIVSYREISRLKASHEEPGRLKHLIQEFQYAGDETCATDGLCAMSCPVGIDTGSLIKHLRHDSAGAMATHIAGFLARHMQAVTSAMRLMLRGVDLIHAAIGTRAMTAVAGLARKVTGGRLPQWNAYMPQAARRIRPASVSEERPSVVYFPSCITRTMGPSRRDIDQSELHTVTASLLRKAGYNIILPDHLDQLCCGMAFASKGYTAAGDEKARELEQALVKATRNGEYPVLVDTSPCLYRMKEHFTARLQMFEPVLFTTKFLAPRLRFHQMDQPVMVHATCSSRKMGIERDIVALASMCAREVVLPYDIECCGWAGDRGFTYPELNASALQGLHASVPPGCEHGYSTGRTCEIGLSVHSGVPYQSVLYLVDRCTEASDGSATS